MDVSWRFLQYTSAYSHYVAPNIYHMKTGKMDAILQRHFSYDSCFILIVLLEFITKVISMINQHWFR